MQRNASYLYSPWTSLFILLGYTVAASFVLQFVMIGIDRFLYGGASDLITSDGTLNAHTARAASLYALLATSTLGTFLLPPLVLQYTEKRAVYFPNERQDGEIYVIVVVFLVVFGPIMQLIGHWNAQLSLPEYLQALEEWMQSQEENMAVLTERIVMVDTIPALLLNIFVMALLPAIAEEFYFRGSMMHVARRMVDSDHFAVWITAILFSAVHLQFYGFFPRLFLGAFFGYMLVWTRNIWVPVLAHFVNNAAVTIFAYSYARQGKTYEDLQSQGNYSIFVYLGSLILAAVIAYWFYRRVRRS